jgi:hypothetical protein
MLQLCRNTDVPCTDAANCREASVSGPVRRRGCRAGMRNESAADVPR